MADVQIALLGGFRLFVAGKPVDLPGRKARALLAYLAGAPGLHHRDKLAALLWGETGDREARHNLRQALSIVRKEVAVLRLEGDAIGLGADAVDVDVLAFERCARGPALENLEEAARLYQGPFLEGFDAGGGTAFEEWRGVERERLHELAVEALATLLAQHMRARSGSAGIPVAQRLVVLEPLQETAHRALMRLLAREGRRGAALRQYEACAEALRREVGAEPEPETRRLYLELLQMVPTPSSERPRPGSRAGGPTEPRREGLLLGREGEMAALTRMRETAWQGRPQAATIQGEAGIGKSRLVAELVGDALEQGGSILYGRAYETESILPFWPWIDALRGGAMAAVMETAELHAAWRPELARLFPELGAAESAAVPGGHVRLFEALAHVMTRLAREGPVLLVLEDLHWADEMSLRLLAFVVRRIPDQPVFVVTTAREEERAPALDQVLTELDEQGLVARIRPGPLSRVDTLTLVHSVGGVSAGGALREDDAERIWTLSRGNPFVAVEMIRALVEAGGRHVSTERRLPERVQQAMARRLDRLSERGHRLLSLAAVIGGAFEFPLLSRAAGLTPPEAAEGVEELVARRILRVVDEGLDFTHDLVREVAYDRLLPPRRQALHAAVGEAMETMWAGRLESVYDRLAVHFARADDAPRAVEYLARFAEQAAGSYAHADAVRALDDAVARTDGLSSPDRDRRRLQLVLQQALSLSILGRFDELLARLEGERPRLERVGDPALASAFFFRLAFTLSYLGDLTRGVVEAQRALVEAERCGDETTAGRSHYVLALHAYYTGTPAAGVEHARRAAVLLDAKPRETHWLGLALYARALNHLVLGEFREALAATAEAAALGEKHGDRRIQSFAALATGWILATQGQGAAGIDVCRQAVELAPDPVSSALAKGRLGLACLEGGMPSEAIGPLEEAIALLDAFKFRPVLGRLTTTLGEAHLGVGRLASARELLVRGLEIAHEKGNAAWAIRALGRLAWAQGDVAEAERRLLEALQVFVEIGARFEAARTRLDLAEIARARGDLHAAARYAAEARDALQALGVLSYAARAAELARPFGDRITLKPSGIG
ncbi:MAG: ATP-binding protein [Candidatus Rokuibacteriota bacterium]